MSSLTNKQIAHLKSSIKDINKRFNEIQTCSKPNHILFSPGLKVVNHFSSRIGFHSPSSLSDNDTTAYIQKLNLAFRMSQSNSYSITIIADGGVKKSNIALAVTHIWANNYVTKQGYAQTMNIMPIEAKLMAIHISLMLALDNINIHQILVVTNAISAAKYILESRPNPLQKAVLSTTSKLKSFQKR